MKSKGLSLYRHQPEQVLVNYSVIKLMLLVLFFQVLISVSFKSAYFSEDIGFYLTWPCIAIITILIAHSIAKQSGFTFKQIVGTTPKKHHIIEILMMIVIVLVLGVGGVGLQIYIESIFNLNVIVTKMSMLPLQNVQPIHFKMLLILYVTGAIIVPIYEEIIFRGLLFGSLRKKYSDVSAVLLSALIFAALHFNKLYFNTFVAGIVFALIVIRFGSIYYSIIAHGVWNLFAQYVQNEYGYLKTFNLERLTEFSYWLPELSLFVIGILASYWYFFHYKPGGKTTAA